MDKQAELWDRWNAHSAPRFPHEKVIQFVFRNYRCPLAVPLKSLDLGCGGGIHTVFLSQQGFQTTAVDLSQTAVNNTLSLLQQHQLTARVQRASIDELPLLVSEKFDLILSIGVLDAAGRENGIKACQLIPQLLRPSGKAFLIFAAADDFRVLGPNPYGIYGYTRAELEEILPKDMTVRWIDSYITTYRGGAERQHDFLVTLQRGD